MDANPSGATSIGGAAKRLSALLQEPQEPTPESAEGQEAPEEETKTAEPKAETPESEPKGEEPSDTEPEAPLYKVKVDGEEKEVPLEELTKSYMMESDYRKKTSEVSKQRKALEEKAAEIDAQLTDAQSLLETELSHLESPEMKELKQDDPEAYLREFEKVQKKVDKFNKLKEKRQEEQRQRAEKQIAKERELLEQAIPEWLDTDVRDKEATDVFKQLEGNGFSQEELQQLSDHRMFVLARKAMLYDKLMSQDLSKKEVKTPPKSQQPGTPKDKADRVNADVKQMRDKLRQSGSMRDAARLLATR